MRGLAWTRDAIPFQWIAYWLVLPNLLVFAMWPVGGPPMQPLLMLSGLAALAISTIPSGAGQRLLLLVMMVMATAWYVCAMFNISPLNVSVVPAFLSEVRPWRSPGYLAGAAAVLGAGAMVLLKAPAVPRPKSLQSLAMAILAIMGIGQLDRIVSLSTSSSYHARPGPEDLFTSATQEAGLTAPMPTRRHLVIIVVEGLGMPVGGEEKALFDADWDRPAWHRRYEVRHGLVPYYGSTTNAELRELCGTWGEYFRFDFGRATCLPEAYRSAGYETHAMHSFDGSFFDRTSWYPKLGFDRIEFESDLLSDGVRPCGGIFPGACDRDVPGLLSARLKRASKPQFIYWLTLNTHLPVIADPKLGTDSCELGDPDWRLDKPQLCRMFLLFHQLANAIDRMAMDPDLPPTDILIVGDHLPPFANRDYRSRFMPADVPWILLRSKKRMDRTGDTL